MKQEIMRWQWHQLDHMQIVCSSLQTDNHASTPSVFLQAGCSPFLTPYNSVKELKTNEKCVSMEHIPCIDKLQVF